VLARVRLNPPMVSRSDPLVVLVYHSRGAGRKDYEIILRSLLRQQMK
jgi:hypothetical protein